MRKALASAVVLVAVGAASMAYASMIFDKLPKCSGQLCTSVNCSADVLCVSGAHVKTCAEVCNNGH